MLNSRHILVGTILSAVTASGLLLPTASRAGDDLTINLGNNTWVSLTQVAYAPAGSGEFTPALSDPLGSGDFVDMMIAGGGSQCHYDLRITNEKGEVSEQPDVDLCAAAYYHIN